MASSLASASVVTKATTLPHFNDGNFKHCPVSKVSFRLMRNPRLRFHAPEGLQPSRMSTVVKAQSNKASVDGSANSAASPSTESDTPALPASPSTKSDTQALPGKDENETSSGVLATEESTSVFLSQVANLVKLVDTRDIVELKLKQLDCEVLIRKKEALPHPPSPPVQMAASYAYPPNVGPPAPLPPAPAAASAPASSPAPPPPPAKSSKSSLPPLKCPMAGTFYRSPGPGEPPFVKVGDKVQKGQVLCIIEAMKLMNEIEADQSGTVVEILCDDGKPVSVDMPLFVIQP